MQPLFEIVHGGKVASLTDEDLVLLLREQFRPEIDRLKSVPHAVEGDKPLSKDTFTHDTLSPSRLLFKKEFDEVNRSVTNVLALKWVLANDYAAFVAHQPTAFKLSFDTFQSLKDQVDQFLTDTDWPNRLFALIVALVIGDIGKDPGLAGEISARRGTKSEQPACKNHDELLAEAVACGVLDGPLSLLSDVWRANVILGVDVGATLNIPQLMQGENIPGSLQPILKFRGNPEAFHLKYLEIIFDVSGSGAHFDSCGAKRMTEPVCRSFLEAMPILENLITEDTISLRKAYDCVLHGRGQLVAKQGYPLLSPADRSERALLRLFAMGRVADRATAEQFQTAFDGLPKLTREALVKGLNVDGLDDGQAILLYYVPALFATTIDVMHRACPDKIIVALQSVMRFMTRMYGGSQSRPGVKGSVREHDVSPAIKIIRDPAFHVNPLVLDNFNLPDQS